MKRKRGNSKNNPKKKLTAVARNENQTILDNFDNAECESKKVAESPQGSTNMNGRQAGLGKLLINEKTDQQEVNSLQSWPTKSRNIKTNSLRSLGSSILKLIGHKDLRYNEQELNSALLVIKKIMKMNAAEPFNIPVNPTALGIPDYFDVINTPMDFGTICENLEKGHKYMNSEDVFKDVQLIWNNCIKYNKKGDFILELMKRVKSNFNKQWNSAGLYHEQPQHINGSTAQLSPPEETTIRNNEYLQECRESPVTNKLSQLQQPVQAASPPVQAGLPPVQPGLPPVQPGLPPVQPVLTPVQPGLNRPESNEYVQECGESTVTNKPSQLHPPVQAGLNRFSSLFSQPQQPAEVGIRDSSGMQKKAMGPTRCHKMWNTKGRIYIATNELGQPIGLHVPKLTNFLGTMARDGLMAPLTYVNWKSIPDANKEKMWNQVETKFIIDPKSKSWVMSSLAKKWKDWKSKLKADHYTPHSTNEERLADRDARVQPDQWSILISYWNLDEIEKRSAINKANRAQQKFSHTTGTKSFARLREEEKAKRPDGKEPSQAELFTMTRTRKDGQPVNEESSPVISKLREQSAQESSKGPKDDILRQALGKDRTPLGTPKLTRFDAMRMVSRAKHDVNDMKEKMVSMEKTCAQMASQMSTMMSMMSSIHRASSSPRKDISDVVANSSDPPHFPTSRPVVSSRQTRSMNRCKIQNAGTN